MDNKIQCLYTGQTVSVNCKQGYVWCKGVSECKECWNKCLMNNVISLCT